MRTMRLKFVGLAVSILLSNSIYAVACAHNHDLNPQPRYLPGIVTMTQDHQYMRTHDAPIFWKMSAYYLPQLTDASCSLASATMLINAIRAPQKLYDHQKLATPDAVVSKAHDAWEHDVKQGGDGVTLDQFGLYLKQAIKDYISLPAEIKVIHATSDKKIASLFHQALIEGEKTGRTWMVVNFDLKFISGTEQGGHFSPVGAYDAQKKRVLLMDPYREYFEPYWVPERVVLKSMTTKDSSAHKNRGFVVVRFK